MTGLWAATCRERHVYYIIQEPNLGVSHRRYVAPDDERAVNMISKSIFSLYRLAFSISLREETIVLRIKLIHSSKFLALVHNETGARHSNDMVGKKEE